MFSSILSSSSPPKQNQSQGMFSSLLSSNPPPPEQNQLLLFSQISTKPKTILEIAIEKEEKELAAKRSSKMFDLELLPHLLSLGKKYHENAQYEKAANIFKESAGAYLWHKQNQSKEYASILNLISMNEISLAKYSEAQAGFLQCLEILGPRNEDNASEIADVYQNLSRVLRLFDKDKEAEDYLEKAIEIPIKYHGENSDLLFTKACLSRLERKQPKEFDKDLERANLYLNQLQKIKGEVHSELIYPLYVIANLYFSKRNTEKVREYCEKALLITKEYYGENHYWACRIYHLLGDNEIDDRNYEKALEIFQKYQKIVTSVFHWSHPALVYCKKGLAECYIGLKEYVLAEQEIKESTEISTKLFHETHSLTMSCHKKMARLLETQKKYGEAIEIYKKCLTTAWNASNTKEIFSLYRIIGDLYSKIGQHTVAIDCFKYIIENKQRIYGEDNDIVVGDLVDLSVEYKATKCYNEEIECLKKAIKIVKKKHGKDDAELHRFYVKIGRAYSDLKQDDKAIKKYKKCMEIRIKEYGKDSQAVVDVSHLLARSYVRTKEDYEAVKLYMNCLRVEEKFSELPGEDAMDSFDDLANIYDIRKDYVNAQSLMKKAVQISGEIFKKNSSTRRKLTSMFFGIERDAALGKISDFKNI